MAKKTKKLKPRTSNPHARRSRTKPVVSKGSKESKGAEAVTVFWLLTGFSTAVAELVWFVLRLMPHLFEDRERWLALLTVIFGIALLSGVVTLAVTPIVIRLRKTRPPRPVTVSSVFVGILPLILLGISYFAD